MGSFISEEGLTTLPVKESKKNEREACLHHSFISTWDQARQRLSDIGATVVFCLRPTCIMVCSKKVENLKVGVCRMTSDNPLSVSVACPDCCIISTAATAVHCSAAQLEEATGQTGTTWHTNKCGGNFFYWIPFTFSCKSHSLDHYQVLILTLPTYIARGQGKSGALSSLEVLILWCVFFSFEWPP